MSVLLTFILHELIHGVAMQIFGAHPRYGVLLKHLMLYATAPGFTFRRNSYLVVSLAPLICLSILATLGMMALMGTAWVALFALCSSINAGGAIGDLYLLTVFVTTRFRCVKLNHDKCQCALKKRIDDNSQTRSLGVSCGSS